MSLVLGPLLRRVVGTTATVWVQTSEPATVEVRAGTGHGAARTFSAHDRHFALVVVQGLTPAATNTYQVIIDGEPAWPPPEYPYPAPAIHTRGAGEPVRLVFGSCREASQRTMREMPPDALDAYAIRLAAGGQPWPDSLVLLGDQVYADETSPATRSWLRRRRRGKASRRAGATGQAGAATGHTGAATGQAAAASDADPADGAPADQVIDFAEYARLYLESWTDPEIRWLFSTVPSVMIFDDHEIIDDWNTSAAWRADMQRLPWWHQRIAAGLSSYWVYQHLGNLHPEELAADPVYAAVTAAPDATSVLDEFGARADTDRLSYRWSYSLDLDRTRLVVLDNRCGRELTPGRRRMIAERDWAWFAGLARADGVDHLVIGSSLPWLMPPGVHHLEAATERLADSGRRPVAGLAEKVRRALDLEHWAAFMASFEAFGALLSQLGDPEAEPVSADGSGSGRPGLASVSVLSGDVHHSYVARPTLDTPVPVHQLTCSPVHNLVPPHLRPVFRLAWHPAGAAIGRALCRAAGVTPTALHWDKLSGPYFGNAVGTIVHSGRSAHTTLEGTDADGTLVRISAQPLTVTSDPVGTVQT